MVKKISFVIPVLNEEESLVQLYNEILQNTKKYEYEIIWIDDGSTDNSFSVMKKIASNDANVKVICFRRNFGKAAGLQAGFNVASGDIVFTMDADLQDNPQEIPHFLDKIEAGYDLVSGWKKKRHDPISKTLPSKLFNRVTASTFGVDLHDYNCGFKAYRNELVQELDIYGEMHRYVPALAHAKGFRVGEIEVVHRARQFGKSKYGFERYLRGFLDLITVKLVTSFVHSPLYLFGGLGTSFTFAGFLISLYLTIMKFFFLEPISRRPLLFLGILLIFVGIQFISIGLIGELIVNQNRKNTRNNRISIRERINF